MTDNVMVPAASYAAAIKALQVQIDNAIRWKATAERWRSMCVVLYGGVLVSVVCWLVLVAAIWWPE